MKNDPPIDDVRAVRRRISARFDNDPVRLIDYYIKLQEQYRDRLIYTAEVTEEQDPTAA